MKAAICARVSSDRQDVDLSIAAQPVASASSSNSPADCAILLVVTAMQGTWILERTQSDRFPYRLPILRGGTPWLTLRAQDRWPAAGRHIFRLRGDEPPASDEVLEELERVAIIAVNERGRRLSVVLDRKRYDFPFLKKTYKGRPGESYEQIFWLTQRSIEQHRPAFKLVSRRGDATMLVRIHGNQKYPWRFPGAVTEHGPISAGDYALMDGEETVAVVERKTMDNLLADFGTMPVLHQGLAELAALDNHALVIEAPYADLLSPRKAHHYTPGFCARAIAELHALTQPSGLSSAPTVRRPTSEPATTSRPYGT